MTGTTRPQRKSIRLKAYDYTQAGCYFVTICTNMRICLFGEVSRGVMHPNQYGRIVEEEWLRTAQLRANVAVDVHLVMPNHVHGILWITGVRRGTARRAPTKERFGRPVSGSLATIVRSFKSACTRRIKEMRRTKQRV